MNSIEIGDSSYKLISLVSNHIAIDSKKQEEIVFYGYDKEKIAELGGVFSFSVFKPIYDYLISTDNVTLEMLSNDFPLNSLKKLNTKGTYQILIPNVIIENQIILHKKDFKTLKASIEKEL